MSKSVIRAFIAIDLPSDLQDRLGVLSYELKQRLLKVPIRWVQPENIHLTLKFLGDVSVANLELLKNILATEVVDHKPFEISVGGVGVFPNLRRPRVIWTGVEAPSVLEAIRRGIEMETSKLGYASESRPFSPHLTLGRVARNAEADHYAQLREVIKNSRVGFLGVARIEAVHLFRSDLRPGGAVYTRLFTAPLGRAKIV